LTSIALHLVMLLVILTALRTRFYGAIGMIKDTSARTTFLFLRLRHELARDPRVLRLACHRLPADRSSRITLGFDAVNGEYNRRTLSRVILYAPIYAMRCSRGKLSAGLIVLGHLPRHDVAGSSPDLRNIPDGNVGRSAHRGGDPAREACVLIDPRSTYSRLCAGDSRLCSHYLRSASHFCAFGADALVLSRVSGDADRSPRPSSHRSRIRPVTAVHPTLCFFLYGAHAIDTNLAETRLYARRRAHSESRRRGASVSSSMPELEGQNAPAHRLPFGQRVPS